MQTQTISFSSPHLNKPRVYQAYPQYVGTMRPHVGHKVVCVVKNGVPIVRCADCGEDITGMFYNPRILEAVGTHLGHTLKCVTRENEVYVICETCDGKDVVGSTPF